MSFEWRESELGYIPKHWEVKSIKEIGEVVGGGTPSTKNVEYYGGNISWITPKDLSGYSERYIYKGERNITDEGLRNSSAKMLPKGSVLFSSRAPIGYVAIAGKDLCTNQGFKSIVCNKSVDNTFIYYTMKMSKNAMESIAGGSTFKEVSGSTVKEFKIKVPPIQEQEYIADLLSSLDDKIELNNAINKNLEEMAQALFKHWFVDFEFPNENGEPYKSSGGEFEESELGLIPKGWRVKNIADFGEFKNGINYGRDTLGNSEFRVCNVRNIVGKHYLIKDHLDSISIDYKKAEGYLLKEGDVLIVRSASPGETVMITKTEEDLIYSGFVIRFRPSKRDNSEFFFFHFNKLKNELDSYSTGTTLKNLNQQILKSIKVAYPNPDLIDAFHQQAMTFLDLIDGYQKENNILTALRDTLLPKLMSGEIRVPLEQDHSELDLPMVAESAATYQD